MKNKEELENILSDVFSEDIYDDINLAYLLGSRAEKLSEGSSLNDPVGPLSDYDFGIVVPHEIKEREGFPPPKRFKLQSRLSGLLDSEVDLVLLNEAPIELQYNVISSGILLFERAIKYRVEYEAEVLGRYGDYLPVLRQQRKDIIDVGSDEARVQRVRKAPREVKKGLKELKTDGKKVITEFLYDYYSVKVPSIALMNPLKSFRLFCRMENNFLLSTSPYI